MIYRLKFVGYYRNGGDVSETVEVGPAPDLATAIMWERVALEQSGIIIQTVQDLTIYEE